MLATSKIWALCLTAQYLLAITWTFSLVWLAGLGEYYVDIAVQVHCTKVFSGHIEDMPTTTNLLAVVGSPSPLATTVQFLPERKGLTLSKAARLVMGLSQDPLNE